MLHEILPRRSDALISSGGLIEADVLYSRDQTAAILAISKRSLERWSRDGYGPAITRLHPSAPPKYRGRDILEALERSREPRFTTGAV